MAPSRALLLHRIATNASAHLPPPPHRALSTAAYAARPPRRSGRRQTALYPRPPSRHVFPASEPASRSYSAAPASAPEPPDYLNERELHIFNKIRAELEPVKLEVQDISGGCGSMYGIEIESEKFRGLSVIRQHKLVNEVLKEEIKGWHGVQLRTKAA
ncbi:bola-like protein [Trematosphaeria pertusa]|uniref:Bola-like protein n=1 Tax=Trematosphaeria pertusa TaxID=390896 RepID=A0A6A6IE57_9PLEO|nr:bola-like protein [Trematosphaeria pertusa]KAF2248479.1 bola-like protein [Trematosphaeria pertusa]